MPQTCACPFAPGGTPPLPCAGPAWSAPAHGAPLPCPPVTPPSLPTLDRNTCVNRSNGEERGEWVNPTVLPATTSCLSGNDTAVELKRCHTPHLAVYIQYILPTCTLYAHNAQNTQQHLVRMNIHKSSEVLKYAGRTSVSWVLGYAGRWMCKYMYGCVVKGN